MRKGITYGLLCAGLVALPGSDGAWADGGRGGRGGHFRSHRPHVGVFIGAPLLFYPWWWERPYYYPPVVSVPATPPTYIERGDAGQGYWYHCDAPEGYYPYVKECPGGWTQETPRPPE